MDNQVKFFLEMFFASDDLRRFIIKYLAIYFRPNTPTHENNDFYCKGDLE
jgi:hypothetical protein